MGNNIPDMTTKRQVNIEDFFAQHSVFSLAEAARVLAPPGGRPGTVERLKYHVKTGRLKRMARELYGVVPRGQSAEGFHPDLFLVASAVRPSGVFCYHSALELQGVAHSVWNQCTVFSGRRHPPLEMENGKILFLEHPGPLQTRGDELLGTLTVEYRDCVFRVTGPERTLVEGFRRLDLAGGLEEFIAPASDFPGLDLDLVESVLKSYDIANLWAATGWFLETCRETYDVTEDFLNRLESHRPRKPHYLVRSQRGGTLAKRWNLILSPEMDHLGVPDER